MLVDITVGIAVFGIASYAAWRLARRYRRHSGPWLVDCPQTESSADVTLDAASRLGQANVRVKQCSHWPELVGCDQGCVRPSDPDRAP